MTSAFQSTINVELGFGIVGELFDDSPRRSAPYEIYTADATKNVVGRAFTLTTADPADGSASGVATAGGTGAFVGLLANPKVNALYGTSAGGTLAPSLVLQNYAIGEMVTMGSMIVAVPGACNVGDILTYATASGLLGTVKPKGSITYSQTTTVLTVTAVDTGMHLGVGSVVQSSTGPQTILALGTGTGGAGTYTVGASQSVSEESVQATSVAPTGYALLEKAKIVQYAPDGANVAVVELTY